MPLLVLSVSCTAPLARRRWDWFRSKSLWEHVLLVPEDAVSESIRCLWKSGIVLVNHFFFRRLDEKRAQDVTIPGLGARPFVVFRLLEVSVVRGQGGAFRSLG